MSTKEESVLIHPLVAEIITKNLTESQRTTQQLIDRLNRQLKKEKALVEAIRDGVMVLLDGKWMPTTNAVKRALFPSDEVVRNYMEEQE